MPVVARLKPNSMSAFPEWFESALSPLNGAGEPRRICSLLGDLAYEIRSRARAKSKRDPILDELEYFTRYVCPKGSHDGEDQGRLLEALSDFPMVEQERANAKPKRCPVGPDRERYERIRGELVRRNARLGFKLALNRAEWARSLTVVDLVSMGLLGLFRAVDGFDNSRGYQFSTYATWWTHQSIKRGCLAQDRLIRLPCHLYEKDEHGKDKVPWNLKRRPISLSRFSEESLGPLLIKRARESEREQDRVLWRRELRATIDIALQDLTPRERDIIVRRTGLDGAPKETLEQVGSRHGVSRERIRQIEAGALTRLRRFSILRVFDGKPKPQSTKVNGARSGPRRTRDLSPSDPIRELDPPTSIQKTLEVMKADLGVTTIGDLLGITQDQLRPLRGVGEKRIQVVLKLQKRARRRCLRTVN